jgi:hypothetical protein
MESERVIHDKVVSGVEISGSPDSQTAEDEIEFF